MVSKQNIGKPIQQQKKYKFASYELLIKYMFKYPLTQKTLKYLCKYATLTLQLSKNGRFLCTFQSKLTRVLWIDIIHVS